ncbi:hypothetical protein P7K49_008628 [Saguinus oedipus]|uniref:Uncharacterized protein n=1 Tax=Saguinus oedipus TaxID=9490 RepID=A0ABQ9VYA4_SAGOE|nr:hypothetical protein P7K49_008628 [Saguinus oedipus]
MGEMQGALARARLESLLRPRHKKRAEVQKRSESFLLSGLGKRRRRLAGDLAHFPRAARLPAWLTSPEQARRPGPAFAGVLGDRGPRGGGGRTRQARSRAPPRAPEITPAGGAHRRVGLGRRVGVRSRNGARLPRENLQGAGERSHCSRRAPVGKRFGAATPAFSGGGIKERWKTTPGSPVLPARSAGAFPCSRLGGRWKPITAPRQALAGRSSRPHPRPGLALSMGTETPAAGTDATGKPGGGRGGGGGRGRFNGRAGPAPRWRLAYKARRSSPRSRRRAALRVLSSFDLPALVMTVKTEAAKGTLTYSRMRGMVAILIGECRNQAGLRFQETQSGHFLKVPDQISVSGAGRYEAI